MSVKTQWTWIRMEEKPNPGRKTRVFLVRSDRGEELGYVRYYNHWRTYAFYPRADTLYERRCLTDIAAFLSELQYERKASA